MKSIQNKCLTLLVLTFTLIGYSQESSFNLRREIQLNNFDSKEKIVTLNVGEDTNQVFVKINCRITEGRVTINMISPSGEKKGDFEIESQFVEGMTENGDSNEVVEGTINKNLKMPEKGKWLIVIKPIKASGILRIETKQFEAN